MLEKNTLLKAKQFFDNESYEEALGAYNQVASENPALKESALFLVSLCRRRIGAAREQEVSDSQAQSIFDLVSKPIKNKVDWSMPDEGDILTLLSSIDSECLDYSEVESIIRCAQNSPFQRDLLWYLADILSAKQLLHQYEASEISFNLITLMLLSYDKIYWLRNRSTFIQNFEDQVYSDIRLYDLLHSEPQSRSEGSRLPSFRYLKVPYAWKRPVETKQLSDPNQKWDVHFGTILLNEKMFIGRNLLQHYSFCKSWTLVEGACLGYPPRKVSPEGISLDDCSTLIRVFPDPYQKLRYIKYGWTESDGEAAKSELRNKYLLNCDAKFLVVIDADEFYLLKDLDAALNRLESESLHAIVLPQVHFWKSTSDFITGEYYDVSHTRVYRNHKGMKYIRNHNFPEINGKFIDKINYSKFSRNIKDLGGGLFDFGSSRCYHMGFAKDFDDMKDKSDYYVNRGEDVTRMSTTQSRAAWFGGDLPEKCKVRPWGGEIPAALK